MSGQSYVMFEFPDEWVGGYRPAVVYIYVSDPERCCIDFGDSEFEDMDLTYKLVDDNVFVINRVMCRVFIFKI